MRWLFLLALGCSAPVESGYITQSYREQFPDTAPGCITVWSESSCLVSTVQGEPADCASGEDVLLVRHDPDEWCMFAVNHGCDCSNRVLNVVP